MARPDEEHDRYKKFVERSLQELRCGLSLDSGDLGKKGQIAKAFLAWKSGRGSNRNAAQMVLEGRFMLGADDESYLASGLGLLWSTVGDKDCAERSELALAPAALYMPEATSGIRKGLVEAMRHRWRESRRTGPVELVALLDSLRTLFTLPEIRDAIFPAPAATATGAGSSTTGTVFEQGSSTGTGEEPGTPCPSEVPASYSKQDFDQAMVALRNAHAVPPGLPARRTLAWVLNKLEAWLKQSQTEGKQNVVALLDEQQRSTVQVLKGKVANLEEQLGDAAQKAQEVKDVQGQFQDRVERASEEAKNMAQNAATAKAREVAEKHQEELAAAREKSRLAEENLAASQRAQAVAEAARDKVARESEEAKRDAKKRGEERAAERAEAARQEGRERSDAEELVRNEREAGFKRERAEAKEAAANAQKEAVTKALKEQAAKLSSSREGVEKEVNLLKSEVEALTKSRDTKVKDARRLTEAMEKQKKQKERLEKELEELKGKADLTATETVAKSVCETQTSNLNDELATYQERANQAQAEAKKQSARVVALEAEVADKTTKARAVEQEEEAKRAGLEAELAVCSEKLGAAVKEREEAEAEKAEADAARQQADEENAEADEERAEKEAEWEQFFENADQQLRAKDEEVSKAKDATKQAQEETKQAQEDAEQAQTDAAKAEEAKEQAWEKLGQFIKGSKTFVKKDVADGQGRLAKLKKDEQELEKYNANAGPPATAQAQTELDALMERKDTLAAQKGGNAVVSSPLQAGTVVQPPLPAVAVVPSPLHWPTFLGAPYDDPSIATALLRGIVGQRGPTEPADVAHCAQDALLPYTLPDTKELARTMAPVRHILEHGPKPTDEEVAHAQRICRAMLRAPEGKKASKRQRRIEELDGHDERPSMVIVAQALEALGGNLAITGVEPVHEEDARQGVEMPYEVRWMPQGPRAATMARVAVLEHAISRCRQVASLANTPAPVAQVLREAAATFKLQQLEPLYALEEAAAFDDAPHPLGTSTPLVTRPCAVVRGVLSYPTDAGVVPRPAQVGTGQPGTDTAQLQQAMGKTAVATAALRNQLRRERAPAHFYVAPPADELAYHPAASTAGMTPSKPIPGGPAAGGAAAPPAAGGAAAPQPQPPPSPPSPGPPPPEPIPGAAPYAAPAVTRSASTPTRRVNESVNCTDLSLSQFLNTVHQAQMRLSQIHVQDPDDGTPDPVDAYLEQQSEFGGGGAERVTAYTRREGIWTEFQRHMAISQDRLWIFIRLMSGCIGGEVSEVITMADEATLAATKAIQQQRVEISKRVGDTQAKIVEAVVGSMLKNSNLAMDLEKDTPTVIDLETKKKLAELAGGTRGLQFFTSSVEELNGPDGDAPAPTLSKVLKNLAAAGMQMQSTLEAGLTEPGMASATLAELSHPSNSYHVSVRADAMAAIRDAHQRVNTELALHGGGRRLALWELVEGGCAVLTLRFADFCGFLLVQKRSSTGVSAMYVSNQSIRTNSSQARISLARVIFATLAYIGRVPAPSFDHANPEQARWQAIATAEKVVEQDVVARPITLVRSALAAPIHVTGWSVA